MKKTVYRPGDIVRIVNNRFIARVGYPLVFTELLVEFESHPRFAEAMVLLGVAPAGTVDLPRKAKHDAVEGLAKAAVRMRGWGGKERRIHYEEVRAPGPLTDEDIFSSARGDCTGMLARVLAKKVRMTGDYYPPWSGQTFEGEHDYEPGGLSNAKAHVILSTDLGLIEACDVELVRDA